MWCDSKTQNCDRTPRLTRKKWWKIIEFTRAAFWSNALGLFDSWKCHYFTSHLGSDSVGVKISFWFKVLAVPFWCINCLPDAKLWNEQNPRDFFSWKFRIRPAQWDVLKSQHKRKPITGEKNRKKKTKKKKKKKIKNDKYIVKNSKRFSPLTGEVYCFPEDEKLLSSVGVWRGIPSEKQSTFEGAGFDRKIEHLFILH